MARLVPGVSHEEVVELCEKFGVPDRMAAGIQAYFVDHVVPGSFLTAVLQNDLKAACQYADYENQRLLFNYVNLFYNEAPSGSWGTEGRVHEWTTYKGEPAHANG